MDEAERTEREKQWDSRTPLERLESLTEDEQGAFLALFSGGRCHLQGAWSSERGLSRISFGKAECDWADFDLWRYKLPGLRLTNYEEGPRKAALGMAPGSVVWSITIRVTDDGLEAREAYWAKWREEFAEGRGETDV
jgi:hypothetical protein